MFDIDKNSLEYQLIHLQNLGLSFNEYKQHFDSVPIYNYEQLLGYSIEMLKEYERFQKSTWEVLDKCDEELALAYSRYDESKEEIHEKVYRLFGIPILKRKTTVHK